MQKIVPHLWFNKEAFEAATFYASIFPDSHVAPSTTLHDTPSGDATIVSFTLMGFEFMAISAGPLFSFNPSISMMVNFDPSVDPNAEEQLNAIWDKLMEGGKALMPIDEYPFSKRYGWVEDKFGFTWQLILTNPAGEARPTMIPAMLFVSDDGEQAEQATDFYLSLFADSRRGTLARYPAGMGPNKEGALMFTDFQLAEQWFAAMDGSSKMHAFHFNEAVSLMVKCKDQEEIDFFWGKLSAVPEAEQCGWIKDAYGVSWQIVPERMGEIMSQNLEKTTPVMLKMKKIIISELEDAARS